MFWGIVAIFFMLYVIFSLSTMKYQLKLISKKLNVEDAEEELKVSNAEIEKELEDD